MNVGALRKFQLRDVAAPGCKGSDFLIVRSINRFPDTFDSRSNLLPQCAEHSAKEADVRSSRRIWVSEEAGELVNCKQDERRCSHRTPSSDQL